MLRLLLGDDDLARVRVASRPGPLLELATQVRGPRRTGAGGHPRHRGPRGADEDRGLLVALLRLPCTPGFLQPDADDAEEAVDLVCGVPPERAGRDLLDNLEAGYPLPSWTAELARRGLGGQRLRERLRRALRREIAWRAHDADDGSEEHLETWADSLRVRARQCGAVGVLSGLGPGVRYRPQDGVLELDLASGAEVDTRSTGSGITIVPSRAAVSPAATVRTEGPATVVVPLRPGGGATGGPESPRTITSPASPPAPTSTNPGLGDLIGHTRALLLAEIARHPGLGVRALARRTGVAAATASAHLRVLHGAGAVTRTPDVTRGFLITGLGDHLLAPPLE